MEYTLAETLEDIEKSLKNLLEMLEGNHRYKGKQKVQKFEIGMSSKPINMETQAENANVQKMEQLFKAQ